MLIKYFADIVTGELYAHVVLKPIGVQETVPGPGPTIASDKEMPLGCLKVLEPSDLAVELSISLASLGCLKFICVSTYELARSVRRFRDYEIDLNIFFCY